MGINMEQLDRLRDAATEAAQRAYCPHSHYPVGAAILADDGRIFSGCNVENASYGLTMCAERVAVFRMIDDGASRIVALALHTSGDEPALPCGACRQVIHEFGPDAEIFAFTANGKMQNHSMLDLLPEAFSASNIEPLIPE